MSAYAGFATVLSEKEYLLAALRELGFSPLAFDEPGTAWFLTAGRFPLTERSS